MIILVTPKYFEIFERPEVQAALARDGRIPMGTPIVCVPELADYEDDDGNPIIAFRLSAGETHYWRGEPLQLPDEVKAKL